MSTVNILVETIESPHSFTQIILPIYIKVVINYNMTIFHRFSMIIGYSIVRYKKRLGLKAFWTSNMFNYSVSQN